MYKVYIEGIGDVTPPESLYDDLANSFRISDLPQKIRKKIRVRGAQRTACWIWIGTIKPARERLRASRYQREYEVFGELHRPERDKPVPEAWDSRTGTGKKVPAHRLVRSVLTCVPIDDVPGLSRCHDPACVSPFHNLPARPAPGLIHRQTQIKPQAARVVVEVAIDVLAALKEHRPFAGVQVPEDFPSIEEECSLPAGSLTSFIWFQYTAWDEEHPDDD